MSKGQKFKYLQNFILRYCFLLSVAWTIVIFILCATPGEYIPSNDWLELLSIDKLVHASIFFILTSLYFLTALKNGKGRIIVITCFSACVIYGAFLEFMQAQYFRNRSADWKDIVANTLGCLVAFTMIKTLRKYYLKSNPTH